MSNLGQAPSAADACPVERRSRSVDGALPPGARSRPDASPGVPPPEGGSRFGRDRAGRPAAARARIVPPLQLQPHHDPACAQRACPRGSPRAHPRARHVRAQAAHRTRLRRHPKLQRGDAAARPRSGNTARGGPAGVGGRGRGTRARSRGRLADRLRRAPASRLGGTAPARAGPPAGRAVSRPPGLRPRAQLAVRRPDRAVRHAHCARPRIARTGAAADARGAAAQPAPANPRARHRRRRLR